MQGKTINGYTLKHLLGKGGMAEVWYAENSLGKKAAVKFLKKELSANEDIVERFRNEAKVMVSLDHPNIRQVYDYAEMDGQPAIIMEYLEGDDLKTWIKRGRHFTDDELVKLWNDTVDALNYTHKQGVVHRDIKPSNIFITNKGVVKILDFGIAKIKEATSGTKTGSTLGTLIYMSPEQIKDPKRVDYRTDVYSLAVSFVHLLTGKVPYDSTTNSEFDIQLAIVQEPLDLSKLPSSWRNFLEPYLSKDREQRPALKPFNASAATAVPASSAELTSSASVADFSASDDEGTVVDAPKKPEPKPVSQPKTQLETKPTPETKRKLESKLPLNAKWLFILGAAVIVVALVIVLSSKSHVPSFEELKLHKPDEFTAKEQRKIGDRYYEGGVDGYPLDLVEAAIWYRMAARQGESAAQDRLKVLQRDGFGATPNGKIELKQIIAERMRNYGPNCNLNDVDVSKVTQMDSLFYGSQFNGDISKWDVSNVTHMWIMFEDSEFNGDISKWNVSNVTDMSSMFRDSKFNGDISNWDVSNVTYMRCMFENSPFNGDISKWDVSKVKDMSYMFSDSQFNGDISEWNVSNVTDMGCMFEYSPFNGDISKWDVSNVTYMAWMFADSPFNGDISKWDVSNVTDMRRMFYESPFNGDISKWNVSNVTYMDGMFDGSPLEGRKPRWYKE